jgi:hypothetical protein
MLTLKTPRLIFREYVFSSPKNCQVTIGRKSGKRLKREFILETDLPPGYSPGFLSSPG